jgi:formylglycine-generating enzyme required for sulfatase activity
VTPRGASGSLWGGDEPADRSPIDGGEDTTLGSEPVSGGTPQLRIGVTRDKGFLYRTCLRPPMSATVGRNSSALLPLDDPEAPDLHTLFSVGAASCLLDFRPEWQLRVFRDERAVTGEELLAEGVAFRRGRRMLLQMGVGTRGSLRIGGARLLFKWEVVPNTDVGDVPLLDLGDVPRCHACGLAMRDALPREGLFARCDACRAINRFVDPEAPYRRTKTRKRDLLSRPFYELDNEPRPSERLAALEEEADTMLGVPIFAPTTRNRMEPLPEHLRPAGVSGPPLTPPDLRAARAPMKALEGMQTVLSRSPFLGPRPPQRTEAPEPSPARGPGEGREPAHDLIGPPADEVDGATPDWLPRRVPGGSDIELPMLQATPDPAIAAAAAGAVLAPIQEPAVDAQTPQRRPEVAASAPGPEAVEEPDERAPPPDEDDEQELPELLDDAFYGAEVEALLFPESVPAMATLGSAAPGQVGEDSDASVPWSTFSVLSADSRFVGGSGRIPHQAVEQALGAEQVGRGVGVGTIAGLAVAVVGVGLLTLGVWLLPKVLDRAEEARSTPDLEGAVTPAATPAATPAPTAEPNPWPIPLDRARFSTGSYLRRAPDQAEPRIVETDAFWLDRLEVTTVDFELFLEQTGRPAPGAWSLHRPTSSSRLPVTGVSADDARAFCAWVGGRLPIESEWERAAGGPSGRPFPWGDRLDAKKAATGEELFEVGAHPAGRTSARIEDLVGNAVEWVDPTDGGEPFLKGGGAAPWNRAEYLGVFGQVPSGAERWAPGPGFRCAADPRPRRMPE